MLPWGGLRGTAGRLRLLPAGIGRASSKCHVADATCAAACCTARRYVNELSRSVFCLAPAGVALWSFRFTEAIFAGCIPVLYDDARNGPLGSTRSTKLALGCAIGVPSPSLPRSARRDIMSFMYGETVHVRACVRLSLRALACVRSRARACARLRLRACVRACVRVHK
jgi:hypothetical protein